MTSAVAIECLYSDSSIISSSGFKLSDNYVLTHGTLIAPILEQYFKANNSENASSVDHSGNIKKVLKESSLKFRVYEPLEKNRFGSLIKPKKSSRSVEQVEQTPNFLKTAEDLSCDSNAIDFSEASIHQFWIYSKLVENIRYLMPARHGWKLSENKDLSYVSETLIMSSFIILSVNSSQILPSFDDALLISSLPVKGDTLVIESSPFGTICLPLFLNSLSKGIISNIDKSGILFVSDARCIYGCEGAPCYTYSNNRISLCGFVLTPFCWRQGEWLGLSLLCSAIPLFKSFNSILDSSSNKRSLLSTLKLKPFSSDLMIRSSFPNYSDSIIDNLKKCLVSIEILPSTPGSIRGTGFIVSENPGIIVTCAHVIESTKNGEVSFTDYTGKKHIGKVLFKTNTQMNRLFVTKEDIWDLAIIASSGTFSHCLKLYEEHPIAGTSVITAGFGPFEPNYWGPFFSRGVISKVLKFSSMDFFYGDPSASNLEISRPPKFKYLSSAANLPVYFQTTCDVYAGTSGGPVISYHPEHGLQATGVIVCNTGESSSNAKFPYINLAASTWLLASVVKQYCITQDVREFDPLLLKSRKSLLTNDKDGTLKSKI